MSPKVKNDDDNDGTADDSPYISRIETSFQPMDVAFHPHRDNLVAAALVDGSLEVHDFRKDEDIDPTDSDDEYESLLSSLSLHAPSNYTERSPSKKTPTASCKCVAFSPDGRKLYTGGSPYGDMCAIDAERACSFSLNSKNEPLWRIQSATASTDSVVTNNDEYNINKNKSKNNPLVALYPFCKDGEAGTPLLATGDDNGGLRIWDERLCGGSSGASFSSSRPKGCVLEWNEQQDYISGIEYYPHSNGKNHDGNNILLATSADGSLGVYDLRMNKGTVADTTRTSDHLDDELLSLCVLKSGRKIVCGTQTGALSIFSWGTWGDISDRFPGHPSSVETLLKVDENTILTGSSDGLIRVVQIHPDKLLGVLNDDIEGHEGYPVEKIAFNSNRDVVGSVTHDNFVRLWDARILKDDDDDHSDNDSGGDDDDDDDVEDSKKPAGVAKSTGSSQVYMSTSTRRADEKHNSDDEWEDMDDNKKSGSGSDDDSDDSDDSEPEQETANDRRKKRLKTENEKFFDDL